MAHRARENCAEQGRCCARTGRAGVLPRSEHCLRAADIGDDAQLHGLVAFLFACHGAGTPAFDQFLADRANDPVPIAERPFVAALPAAAAVAPQRPGHWLSIGHVERAWGYSIRPRGLGPRLRPFRNLLSRVLRGEPVGHATKDLSDRFTAASAQLNMLNDPSYPGARPPPANWPRSGSSATTPATTSCSATRQRGSGSTCSRDRRVGGIGRRAVR